MRVDVIAGRRRVSVGPPGGPAVPIAAAYTITVSDSAPYDLVLRLEWNEAHGRLLLQELTFRAQPSGEPVRMANIIRVAIADLVEKALELEVLGARGWAGVVGDHADWDPVAVDALVYLLSVAIGGQRPSATVARARGLSPATGPKRVSAARQAGLIPPTDPGKPSAASTGRATVV